MIGIFFFILNHAEKPGFMINVPLGQIAPSLHSLHKGLFSKKEYCPLKHFTHIFSLLLKRN